METLKKSIMKNCPILQFSSEVHHARIFQWLEKEQGSLEYGVDYSFPMLPFSKSNSLIILSSRMLKVCLAAIKEETLPKLSISFPKQGMIFGGKFLMQPTLESHNIEREYSFSELLEDQVSDKYFLNEKMKERILNYKDNKQTQLQGDTNRPKEQERILLNVNSMHKLKICTSAEDSQTEFME